MNSKLSSPSNHNNFFSTKNCLIILQITCAFIFIGRGYQHIFWDGPYRSILWDQELLEGFVNNYLNIDWKDFVESEIIGNRIQLFIKTIGVIFILSAFSVFGITSKNKWPVIVISTGVFFMALLAFASFKVRFYQIGEWFEFGTQVASPILLILFVKKKISVKKLIFIAKIAIAITFIGHGFYAFGYYPQPGGYVDMVINITGFSEDFVRPFLKVMGFMDFVVALLLFIPKTARPALIYCIVWGLLTAFARVVSYFNLDFPFTTLHQWLYQTVFRLSHGLLPLWVLCLISTKKIKSN